MQRPGVSKDSSWDDGLKLGSSGEGNLLSIEFGSGSNGLATCTGFRIVTIVPGAHGQDW